MSAELRTVIAVPARYGSTRLPGKALLSIGGEPMIVRVWRNCLSVRGVSRVIVATDDDRIRSVLEKHGADVRMTSASHRTGTDRIAEALRGEPCDIVVNVQGDEPFLGADAVEALMGYFRQGGAAPVATLASPIRDGAELFDPSAVKVVVGRGGEALYFSRLPIPFRDALWERSDGGLEPIVPERVPGEWGYLKHIGVYAFRRDFLQTFSDLDPTPAQESERLEQLRILEHGERIHVVIRDINVLGVDTPEDLEEARRRAGGA